MSFLFVDRILYNISNIRAIGIKHVTYDDVYLSCDDKGNLYFSYALIGETLGQLAAWNIMSANNFSSRPVAGIVDKVYLYRPAYVGETIILEVFIDQIDNVAVQYHGVVKINNDIILRLDGAIGPLLPMKDFIDARIVRRQFAEIYRPASVNEISLYDSNIFNNTSNNIMKNSYTYYHYYDYDNLIDMRAGIYLIAKKLITRSARYFCDHFPNNPVLPMTVLLEHILFLVKKFLLISSWQNKYYVVALQKIKMNVFIRYGDILINDIKIKSQDKQYLILNCQSKVDKKRVCTVDIILGSI